MTKPSVKVIFFGNEKLATGVSGTQPIIRRAVEAAGFEIEQVVTGPLSDLGPHQAKLAVLAAYGRVISQMVLDQFPLGIINVHPSLLPQYRGPTPIEQAILDGAAKTGVSIMRLVAKMDEGPIYKQKTLHLMGNESKVLLARRLQQLGAQLLIDVLPAIAAGNLKPRRQPHPDRATYSYKITKADGIIDWHKPAEQIEREIRAYLEWPKSRAKIGGKDVIILKARVQRKAKSEKRKAKPGEVFVTGKQLVVQTGSGLLIIEELKPAGKKDMSAQAFLVGHKIVSSE